MNETKIIELPPIKESSEDFDKMEAALKEHFKKEIYLPLLKILKYPKKLLNAKNALADALRSGRITYYRGQFSGRFNSEISKELKSYGANWDRKTRTFRLSQSSLPNELRALIAASDRMFRAKIADIDKTLSQILPEEIADKFKSAEFFDSALWKVDKEFKENVKGITITPTLTKAERKKIADDWQNNMNLYIKDWTQKNIKQLRKEMKEIVFTGNRFESAVKTIQKSYGVSARKAKFLARQETNLLMTKFKETRYEESGIFEYKWGCVAGSPNHPVRPWHKALEGKIFRFDTPPVTTKPGEPQRRNNPGQDFNCRCFARPIVRVKKK
jgi:SPP1 gp7 family putative phage head morphogenesis protein